MHDHGSGLERVLRAAAEAAPGPGGVRVVAIDGPSGSGKTTLAAALAARLDDAQVVHMDDLYPGWDGLDDAVPRLVEWVLAPLSAGRPARYRRWDWPAGRYAEWHDVAAAPVVLVEGVGCGAAACSPHLSLLVWLDAALDLRRERGLARDGDAFAPHWQRWADAEAAHFAAQATRERAGVRVLTG